jgi:serine/threonine protein kinase
VNEAENMVGRKLGDYTLERKLAVGGMAHIYLGRDAKLERMAAIKILSREMLNDSVMAQRFEREARAIAKLEHESIIPIYQFGEQDGQYFLAMRYVEGRDLAQEINDLRQKGKLMDVRRALTILEKVASALDYAHRNNIIHRDIKPSNVLLGANDKVYLSDFGLAMLSSDKTLGTAFGTPRYISPEQATDSLKTVPQSDIYSLAVMVYEILTGALLFDAPHPLEVALAHVTQQPKPPRAHNPAIPAQAQEEILKGLSKDPHKRHQTAMEFIQALKTAYESAFKDNSSTIPFAPDDFETSPELTPGEPPSTRATPPVRPTGVVQELSPRDTQPFRDRTGTQPLRPKGNTLSKNPLRTQQPPPRSFEMMLLYVLAGAAVTIMVVVVIVLAVPQPPPAPLPTAVVLDADLTNTSVALGLLVETANASTLTSVASLTPPTAEGVVIVATDEAAATEEANTATSTPSPTPLTPTVTPSSTITETPNISPSPGSSPTATELRAATLTPTTLPTSVGIVEGQNPLTLRYNDQMVALINPGDKTIAIEQLSMRGLSGDEDDSFSNSGRSLGLTLKPGECVVVRSGRAVGDVPAEWNCSILLETTLNKNTLFWRADAGTPSEDTQFVVKAGDDIVGTCDTAGRAVGRIGTMTCDVLWPVQASNSEPTPQG